MISYSQPLGVSTFHVSYTVKSTPDRRKRLYTTLELMVVIYVEENTKPTKVRNSKEDSRSR